MRSWIAVAVCLLIPVIESAAAPGSLLPGSGYRQVSVPFKFSGTSVTLDLHGGKLALLYEDHAMIRCRLADPKTLVWGPPSEPAPEAPANIGDGVRPKFARVPGGWIAAKEISHGRGASVTIFRMGLDGRATRVMPPGEVPEGRPVAEGTVYAGGERFDSYRLIGLVDGFGPGPVLFALRGSPYGNKPRPALEVPWLALVGADGHPVLRPVPVPPDVPIGGFSEGVPVPGGFLIACHVEPRSTNPWHHGLESVVILKIGLDGSATVADRWDVQKESESFQAVTRLRWAVDGDLRYVVYGGSPGIAAARIGPDGHRSGPAVTLYNSPGEAEGGRIHVGDLFVAQAIHGRLRLLVTDPVRMVEADPAGGSPAAVRWTMQRMVMSELGVLSGDSAYLVWSRGVQPPPYLSRVSK